MTPKRIGLALSENCYFVLERVFILQNSPSGGSTLFILGHRGVPGHLCYWSLSSIETLFPDQEELSLPGNEAKRCRRI